MTESDLLPALSLSSASERCGARRFQKFFGVCADVAFAEDGVASNQQLGPCAHDVTYRIDRHAAVHLDAERQPKRFAHFGKCLDFLQSAGNKLLCAES